MSESQESSRFEARRRLQESLPARSRQYDLVALWEGTLAPASADSTSDDPTCSQHHEQGTAGGDRSIGGVAFAEALEPTVDQATKELKMRAGDAWSRLSSQATTTLRDSLLRLLGHLCAQPLLARYESSSVDRSIRTAAPEATPSLYDNFVRTMRRGGLRDVLKRHPRLARTIDAVLSNWIDSTHELLLRLTADAPLLERAFGLDIRQARTPASAVGASQVVAVETDLSDRHDGGRVVSALSFENGKRVVYKPRHVGMERAYNALLQWLNQSGLSPELRSLTVLERSGYGWVEAAAPRACESIDDVKVFYERAGMLLALLAFLGATDCHMANVGACGPHPVLWDAETLLTSRAEGRDHVEQGASPSAAFVDVVSNRLGFLPYREHEDGYAFDLSALGGTAVQPTIYRVPVWQRDLNNGPRIIYEPAVLVPHGNRVYCEGTLQRASRYAEEISSGFRTMYAFLSDHRDRLMDTDGPLVRIARQPRRHVVRRTRDYYKVLTEFLWACYESADSAESVARERLRRLPFATTNEPPIADLLEHELAAIVRLDIPRFTHRPHQQDVRDACVHLKTRLDAMTGSDLEPMLSQIRVALVSELLGN